MRRLLLQLSVLAALFMPVMVPAAAAAACPDANSASTSKQQVLVGVGETDSDCNGDAVPDLLHSIVNIISLLVGAIAIIMIIVSGFKYITSGGDSAKVSSAKNTLIYAMIGLAVAVLAQLIVNVVFTQSKNVIKNSGSKKSSLVVPSSHGRET
jgi:hypothetical protein